MDGIILINKEKNYTSNDVVQIIKHTLNKKVGHIGTLDPNATGVLPLLVGNGTKISKYLINHDKIYEATIKLGKKTDTADEEGNLIETRDVDKEKLTFENIDKVIKKFQGVQEQTPPMYSAIKVKGRKLYDYARRGENVEIKPRKINIYNIEIKEIDIKNSEIKLKIECSKGTYIRTLCEDIAYKLDTVGYMKELNRIQVGEFNIDNAIKIQDLKDNKDNIEYINKHTISIEKVISGLSSIFIKEEEITKFLNGVRINRRVKDGVYKVYNNMNQFMGTAIAENGRIKRDVII